MALSLTAAVSMTGCSSASDQVADTENATVENSKLIMTLSTASSVSRADNGTIIGTDSENYLTDVSVFFCTTNDKIQYVVDYSNINNSTSVIVALNQYNIPTGTYHIYLGANLPSSAKTQLVNGVNILKAIGSITSISELTSPQKFTMFGQAFNGSDPSITFSKGNVSSASVSLSRVMAKVLLTAKEDAANAGYVECPDAYIKISDITYSLANTSNDYYFNQFVEDTTVKDHYYSTYDAAGFLNESTSKTAQTFNDSKLTGNNSDYISNSIYCLENTTGIEAGATKVKVNLTATPKLIDGVASSSVTLTDHTFYTYAKASTDADKLRCFSSVAKLKEAFPSADENYIKTRHTTDVYTYETFVTGRTFSASASSVLRNHYYILEINKISTPYLDKTMEINTIVTDWSQKGTTNINIDTAGATSTK